MKKYLFGILYTLFLCAFTVYVLLDTFVITRVYQVVPSENSSVAENSGNKEESTSNNTASGEANKIVQTDTYYADGNISITITEHRVHDTTVYVADVVLSSAEYLKTAFANNAYGKNVTAKTSETAKQNGAILAINGDYYGAREKGYVLRNGVVYRESGSAGTEALVIYESGNFEIVTENRVSLSDLAADNAWQVLSFGPALLTESKISISKNEEVDQAMRSNPRTAIGIVDKLHYLFVVSDGRTSKSKGLSLYELAEFMQSLGATTAYNLDGGGSSTMYFNGKVINEPTTSGSTIKERSVSDIVFIGY